MKQSPFAIVLGAVGLCALGLAQAPMQEKKDLDARVEALEAALEESRAERAELTARLDHAETRIDEIARYLTDQANQWKSVGATLDKSEDEGFTFGINPESRHTLLRGWRAQVAGAQKGLPRVESAPKQPESDGRGRTRRRN